MMRRISMAARDELVAAVAGRYAQGDRGERGRILDEFAAVTGYHRKHAMRLLRAGQVNQRCAPRPGRRVYDDAVREALIVVWEASDRICGKRLRPLAQLRRFEHFKVPKWLRLLRPTPKGRHYSGIGGTGPAVILGGGWAGSSSLSFFSNRLSSGSGSV